MKYKNTIKLALIFPVLIGIIYLISNTLSEKVITTDLISFTDSTDQITFDLGGVLNTDPAFWKKDVYYRLYVNGIKTQEDKIITGAKNLVINKNNESSDYGLELFNTRKRYILNSPVLGDIVDKPQENRIVYLPSADKAKNKNGFLDKLRMETLNNSVYIIKKMPEDAGRIESVILQDTNNLEKIIEVNYYLKTENIKKTISLPLNNDYFWIKFDESFNNHSFLWDDAMVSWFMLKTDPEISEYTLDFWYSLQVVNGGNKGLIPREVRGANIKDYFDDYHKRYDILNPISVMPMSSNKVSNPFILGRLELELYKQTNNIERLKKVLPKIVDYYNWVENNRKKVIYQNGVKLIFYSWDSFGSGMDNIKRCNECGYVDLISQQSAAAKDIKEIAEITGNKDLSQMFAKNQIELSEQIQTNYYDPTKKYVFDLNYDGTRSMDNMTAAGFWSLYSGSLSGNQAAEMITNNILNIKEFGAKPYLPSVSRSSKEYKNNADYWNGGIWPPIVWIGILGLKEYGFTEEAKEFSNFYIEILAKTFDKHGTLFEFYSPSYSTDSLLLGEPKPRDDFFGWSSLPLGL